MNKLYKILAVSLILASHASYGMLSLYKPGASSFKKSPVLSPVLSRSFYKNQEILSMFTQRLGISSVLAGGLALGLTYRNYKNSIAHQLQNQPTLNQILKNNNS